MQKELSGARDMLRSMRRLCARLPRNTTRCRPLGYTSYDSAARTKDSNNCTAQQGVKALLGKGQLLCYYSVCETRKE